MAARITTLNIDGYQMLQPKHLMEDKIFLEDLFKVKKSVDRMDLLEFKTLWNNRTEDYTTLGYSERLTAMVMSLKILQATADFSRMLSSLKECSIHPERDKAIYYYLRTNLWKFLDNFKYILLLDDVTTERKLEGLTWLEEITRIIAQDEQLTQTCVSRLHKLAKQVRILNNAPELIDEHLLYTQINGRISKIIDILEPSGVVEDTSSPLNIPLLVQELMHMYAAFSISRISIEKSGILSIIQLLHEHPFDELEHHRQQLQEALSTIEKQAFYSPTVSMARNQCAYALVVLLEMMKMHKGLPVLLLRILGLCAYIRFPSSKRQLDRELQDLKGRITEISQKRLRPAIEDVLWKIPDYLNHVPHLRKACPWCFHQTPKEGLNIAYIRRVVTATFDRLVSAQQFHFDSEGPGKSRLSETVIEILGLLVNVEPSPHFLKIHAKESQKIKEAKHSTDSPAGLVERLLDQQYDTYKSHLKFLKDSIEYYQGISEKIGSVSPAAHIKM